MPEKRKAPQTHLGTGRDPAEPVNRGRDGIVKPDSSHVLARLNRFADGNLTQRLAGIEREAQGLTAENWGPLLEQTHATREALAEAAELKRLAGQVNVTIHALGILLCLKHVLEPGESVESLSLGAGNTGKPFDLETNRRVAEFKFIRWRGGSESIRQNDTFKDFYLLAAHATSKRKHLFLLDTEHALRFFRGRRKLTSVLSKNEEVRQRFFGEFGGTFRTVGDYYAAHKSEVEIGDVSAWVGDLLA